MATIGTHIYTLFNGRLVGRDEEGNRYYQSKKSSSNKRWVIYKGEAEPSRVPPKWHGWLHHMTDNVPEDRYDWQQPYSANQTGTDHAYTPPGSEKNQRNRDKATGDYEAWQPPCA